MKTFKMFGTIVNDDSYKYCAEDVTPSDMKTFLDSVDPGEEVQIQVNSPGGHITAGLAIANMIKSRAASVKVTVFGIAASMASVIAAAAGKLEMAAGSFLMIHEPWGGVLGTAADMRKEADVLDSMKTAIIGFYASLFPGKTAEQINAMVCEETWIRGDQIAEYGLAATLIDGIPAFGCLAGPARFNKMPADAGKFYAFSKEMADKSAAGDPPAAEPPTGEPPAGEPPAGEPPAGDPPAGEPPAGEPPAGEPPAGEPPAGEPPAPPEDKPPQASLNVLALSAKLEEIEGKRRDLQSRCDKAEARIRDMESTHTAALQARDTKISSLESEVKTAETRISAMTLNALKGPSGGCAQSWTQALEECGGSYEKAAQKYAGLAAAYRTGKLK